MLNRNKVVCIAVVISYPTELFSAMEKYPGRATVEFSILSVALVVPE